MPRAGPGIQVMPQVQTLQGALALWLVGGLRQIEGLGPPPWRLQWLTRGLPGHRLPRPFTAIVLGLSHQNAKAVPRKAQFTCNRPQRRSFAVIFKAVRHCHPYRMFAQRR